MVFDFNPKLFKELQALINQFAMKEKRLQSLIKFGLRYKQELQPIKLYDTAMALHYW